VVSESVDYTSPVSLQARCANRLFSALAMRGYGLDEIPATCLRVFPAIVASEDLPTKIDNVEIADGSLESPMGLESPKEPLMLQLCSASCLFEASQD
jgi:hypothetical protein